MELRLWSDLYLIQGRYIVIMGTPNKTSSLSALNGLDVYPSLYGSLPLMSNRIILLAVGPHFLLSAFPEPGVPAQLFIRVFALRRVLLPATSSFFVLSLLIQTLSLQHLSADAFCNNYGCFIFISNYAALVLVVCGRLISPSIFDAS